MAQSTDDIANLGPQMIFGMDTEGRCTLSVGQGLQAQGLKPGELVGQDLLAYYRDPLDQQVIRRALAGEAFTVHRTLNGRLLRTSFEPVHDADGVLEGVVGVATDLTEHLRTQQDLSKFKSLAEDSQDFMAIADEDGTVSYLNPRLAALGLSVSSEDLWPSVTEVVGASLAAELSAHVDAGTRWSGDLVTRLPTGDLVLRAQLFPLYDADGSRKLGTGWIAQDITELRASEERLQAANADLKQFRALVEASSDFIAIAGLDGRVRYVNPAGRALVGLPHDVDVTSTTIRDFLTPEGIERSERIEQPAVVQHGRWHGESTLKRAYGPPVPVEISSFLVPDPETGEPFALATVQHDITARLAAAQAHEEFVTLVAHELRTPLTSVRGYVEIAGESLESQADPARLSAHLQVAARNIARMERLVEQILRVAGEDKHHPAPGRPVDLVGVVEQAVESARPGVEGAGLRLVLVTGPPVPVALDETFVEVVDNLVSNAAKYTPAGGEIGVSVTHEDDVAVLTVTDDGPGIPPEEREMIFEKFIRGGREGQSVPGLGLGLFITRAIVLSHAGEIDVDERPGGGTRFVVRLPLART